MTPSQLEALRELHEAGYAVCIFTPDELDGASPRLVADIMCERGWEAIEFLKPVTEDRD